MIPDKLFINLKILSKIQKNGRIRRSFDGIISLEQDTFYQSLKRFVSSDSRRQSVSEINSIINETITCLNLMINSKFMNKSFANTDEYYHNCEDISLLLTETKAAKLGIENLKFTYSIDPNIATQLDIILIKIDNLVRDISSKLNTFKAMMPERLVQSEPEPFIQLDEI